MEISQKDINLLCKMENIIGNNMEKIFDEDGKCVYQVMNMDISELEDETVTQEDFVDFVCLIERMMEEKGGEDVRVEQ